MQTTLRCDKIFTGRAEAMGHGEQEPVTGVWSRALGSRGRTLGQRSGGKTNVRITKLLMAGHIRRADRAKKIFRPPPSGPRKVKSNLFSCDCKDHV